MKVDEMTAVLKAKLAGFDASLKTQEVGRILDLGDGIARVSGLDNVQAGEIVVFENNLKGIALNLEEACVGVVLLGDDYGLHEGELVKRTKKPFLFPPVKVFWGALLMVWVCRLMGRGLSRTQRFYRLNANLPLSWSVIQFLNQCQQALKF